MEAVSILDYCRELTIIKSDFVVVGSTSLYLQGVQDKIPSDIDIVVNNLKCIPGKINTYITDSGYSFSKKRAYVLEDGMPKIDIFVEHSLPDHKIISGIRVETIPAMVFYYKEILPNVAEHWKQDILNKIKLLELWQTEKI